MSKKRNKKSGFHRGFKATKIPGDRGYVKPRRDGGRYHKRTKNGCIHVDKVNPKRDPIGHIIRDFLRL